MTRWYVLFLVFLLGALAAGVLWDLRVAHAAPAPSRSAAPARYEFAPVIIRARRRHRRAPKRVVGRGQALTAAPAQEPGLAPWSPREQLCHVYGPRLDGLRVAVCGGSVTHYIAGSASPFTWVPVPPATQRF